MRRRFHTALLTTAVLLAACSPSSGSMGHSVATGDHGMQASPGMGGEHQMMMQKGTRNLTVHAEPAAAPSEVAFSVREGDSVFTDYGTSHTKEMHFIAVRDDLRHFEHLHPDRDAGGVWHVRFTPEAGGTYWLYADFVDHDGGAYSPRFENVVAGERGEYGLVKDVATSKIVDGYDVSVSATRSGKTATFVYVVLGKNGKPVEVEDYLGAKGHSILLTAKGGFLHAHAEDQTLTFPADVEPGTFYRMYTQFQIDGKVLTVPFDWQS